MLTPESYPEAAARSRRPGVAGFDSRSISRILTQDEEVKKEQGVIDSDAIRLPLLPADEAMYAVLRDGLTKAGLL